MEGERKHSDLSCSLLPYESDLPICSVSCSEPFEEC